MPIIAGKDQKIQKGMMKMKEEKESKWHISHNSVYQSNREERLRRVYELIAPELIVEHTENEKTKEKDPLKTEEKNSPKAQ